MPEEQKLWLVDHSVIENYFDGVINRFNDKDLTLHSELVQVIKKDVIDIMNIFPKVTTQPVKIIDDPHNPGSKIAIF